MKEYVYGTDGVEGHWLTNEEIVRCRDCEKLNTVDCPCAWYPLDKTSIMDGLNGFCSWAERREGAES